MFAAWFTYGIAGFFWIHDTYHLHGGMRELKRRFIGTTLALLTILAGAFICVAGTYVFVKVSQIFSLGNGRILSWHVLQLINDAYKSGEVGKPFTC